MVTSVHAFVFINFLPHIVSFTKILIIKLLIEISYIDIEVKKPRICGRQIMGDNVEAETGRLL
jgi:hypothetical protein